MRRRRFIAGLLTLAVAFAVTTPAQRAIDARRDRAFDEELLYLPSEKLLTHFTGGMSSVVADMLWLRCIQYTSKHFRGDRKFTWLNHMCTMITNLDPYFVDVYRYGGIFLAALQADSDKSIQLLQKGMVNNPDRWELPYEVAMVYLINRADHPDSPARATEYLGMAVATGNAPEYILRLAQNLSRMHDLADVERSMWLNVLETGNEEFMRELAYRKLQELALRESCAVMNEAVERFKERRGRAPERLEELVEAGILVAAPEDPLGGRFFLDEDGAVKNTTLLDDMVEQRLMRLRGGINAFQRRTGRWPASLEEAREDGDLTFVPRHPYAGRDWAYDPDTGTVDSADRATE